MKIRYDEQADAISIRFKQSRYHESDEISDGVILDYDRKGRVIGIEILDASRHLLPEELASMQFEIHRRVGAAKTKHAT